MKFSAVAQALSAAAVRLGVSASVQPLRIAAAVYVSPLKLAYALGHFLLSISKEESVSVLSQTISHFFKSLSDTPAAGDQIAQHFYKGLKEQGEASDAEILSFFKGLGEQVAIADVRSFVFGKAPSDRSVALDRLALRLTRSLNDTPSVSDVIRLSLIFTRAYFETAAVRDLYSNRLGKNLFDSGISIGDSILFARSKNYLELVAAVDSLIRNLSKGISDTAGVADTIRLAAVFTRSLNETPVVRDGLAVATRKARTESAQVTDTGSLNKQNYSSAAYFVEDYVGTSNSF